MFIYTLNLQAPPPPLNKYKPRLNINPSAYKPMGLLLDKYLLINLFYYVLYMLYAYISFNKCKPIKKCLQINIRSGIIFGGLGIFEKDF